MKLDVHTPNGKQASSIVVSDSIFAVQYNEPLVHQVLLAYMAGARSGTKAQRSRSEVRGGGRKPWRQKGLGRARAGTIRSPIWRGGGATFAAKPRDYSQKVNRKMYSSAIRSIFSELIRQGRLMCIDEFAIPEPKTRAVLAVLGQLGLKEVLIIVEEIGQDLYLATRNLSSVEVMRSSEVNPYSLIGFGTVLVSRASLVSLEERLS